MQLGARTFLWFFIPVTALLTGSFWSIQRQTLSTLRAGTLASLRQNQKLIAKAAARQDVIATGVCWKWSAPIRLCARACNCYGWNRATTLERQ